MSFFSPRPGYNTSIEASLLTALNNLAVGGIGTAIQKTTATTFSNVSVSGSGGMSIGGTVTNGTPGSLLFVASGPVLAQDNNNAYVYDSSSGMATNTNFGISFNTGGDFTGTDAVNTYAQSDAYLPNSTITNSLTGFNTDGAFPGFTASSSRGTGASPTIVNTGDTMGGFSGWGYTGVSPAYTNLGGMMIFATGSTSANLGGELRFYTKGDGGTLTLWISVSNAGVLQNNGSINSTGMIGSNGNIVSQSNFLGNQLSALNNNVSLLLQNRSFSTTNLNSINAVTGTMTQTSGQFNGVAITPTYNQSASTAANTDLLINRTETSLGSGAQNFVDFQATSVSKFRISNVGHIFVEGVTSTGATGTGAFVFNTSPTMTSPTVGTQATTDNSNLAASTAYVTTAVANAVAAINPAVAVTIATTQASDTSGLAYANGVGGIGATFTGSVNTALTIDGVTLTSVGQRVLVKNDTQSPSGAFNGIYNLTQLQTGILAPVLTRALDYDQPSDMNNTGAIPVMLGTVNANTSWLLTSSVVTVGTTPLTFTQFSIAPTSLVTLTGGQTVNGKTFTGTVNEIYANNAITATSNAATVPITSRLSTVTNNSAAALTITLTTSGATDGQLLMIRVLDFSAVAETLTWVNTENSTVSVPTTSNGSTTLPVTVGFMYNSATSKWRCIASC